MSRLITTVAIVMLVLLWLGIISPAQEAASTSIPKLIRFSGTLGVDREATPTTTVGVTFAIYRQQDGGAPAWLETQNVTPDANGKYVVLLGSTTSTGLPDDLFSQLEQRWLGVQVQGQAEQARVLLVSVPYAFKAREAETLGGLPASAFVRSSQPGAVGSASQDTEIAPKGGGPSTGKAAPKLPSCSPVSGFISYWDTSLTLCPSLIQQAGLGVGIGKLPSLGTRLDVNGDVSTADTKQSYEVNNMPVLSVFPLSAGNLFVGTGAGSSNSGIQNTFVGSLAGSRNTTGSSDVYVANRGPASGTEGSSIRIGNDQDSTYAQQSAAYVAGIYNQSTSNGSAVFIDSLGKLGTLGGGNLGNRACAQQNYQIDSNCEVVLSIDKAANSTDGNLFIGVGAGSANGPTAMDDTFSGYGAGSLNKTGSDNTYLGFFAGYYNPASDSTFLGSFAGYRNKGSGNNFTGYKAGFNNLSGTGNIYIGNQGLTSLSAESYTIRIGNDQDSTYAEQRAAYIAGTYGVPLTSNAPLLVEIDNTGHLGTGLPAGVVVAGNCTSPVGGTYLSLWGPGSPSNMVGCSFLFQSTNLSTKNFIGIGTTNPSAALDVNGDISAKDDRTPYQIAETPVLSIFGVQNLLVGAGAGPINTGGSNTFVGNGAGNKNVAGYYNTFTGAAAGQSNTVGLNNSFYGVNAGSANVGGGANVFIGSAAGSANVSDSNNTYVGQAAGQFSTGSFNTFLGTDTGANNTGANNIYLGFGAGNSVGAGTNNVEIGNVGVALDNGYIRIGTAQRLNTYIAGIYLTPVTTNQFVVVDALGHLGSQTITSGTGNVVGPGNCVANYLTLWAGGNNVGCSLVYQVPSGMPTAGFIGIGTMMPSTALDVNGDINALLDQSSYKIGENTVLSAFGDRNMIVGYNGAHAGNTGSQNTFVGDSAGVRNTNGSFNTFVGSAAGAQKLPGSSNTCMGQEACRNVTGDNNTMVGVMSGVINAGGNNTFLGYEAGQNNDTGSSNIYLGNDGTVGESNAIRIGTQGANIGQQNKVFIEPILASTTSNGANVFITAAGQLVMMTSSRRYKEQIADMGDLSSKLLQLRPVTFFYKPQYDDGSHLQQYGLIAEEVAKVYPEMVMYGKDGQPLTVKYQLLAPMLLNEFQKQHAVVTAQQGEMTALREQTKAQQQQMLAQQQQIEGLKSQLQLQNAAFQERLSRLESLVTTRMQTAATDKPTPATTPATGGLQ